MKDSSRRSICTPITLTLLCLLFTVTTAVAQGRFEVKPHVVVDWESDSNFNYTETNEKTVHTYTVEPGIALGYVTDKSEISLDYYIKVFRYDDQDENIPGQVDADEYDYTAHNARFNAQTKISHRLLLGLDNITPAIKFPNQAA